MRLFYALTFHQSDKETFARIRDEFKVHTPRGSYMSTDNFHLTLLFLGDVKEEHMTSYLTTLSSLATDAIAVNVNRLGVFKKKNKHILWLGIEDNDRIHDLHNQLMDKLSDDHDLHTHGTFTPHITIARNLRVEEPMATIKELNVDVRGIALMESVRVNDVLCYRPIKEYLLRQKSLDIV